MTENENRLPTTISAEILRRAYKDPDIACAIFQRIHQTGIYKLSGNDLVLPEYECPPAFFPKSENQEEDEKEEWDLLRLTSSQPAMISGERNMCGAVKVSAQIGRKTTYKGLAIRLSKPFRMATVPGRLINFIGKGGVK